MAATTIPVISSNQFQQRLARQFPRGWASEDAKQTGVYGGLFLSIGTQLSVVLEQLRYVFNALYLQTATAPELDLISRDYLGNILPRPPGMEDGPYAQLILREIFRLKVTRLAIRQAILDATGVDPRIIEPWNIFDTGTWNRNSYWGVDTQANPARWGNGGVKYQGFVEVAPLLTSVQGLNHPLQTWGHAYWNVPGYFFGAINTIPQETIFTTLNRIKAYGTTIWIKTLPRAAVGNQVPPSQALNLVAGFTGSGQVYLTWKPPLVGSPEFTYLVRYRLDGTLPWLLGPTTLGSTVILLGLTPNVAYNFEVITTNTAGKSESLPITFGTSRVVPSPALNLAAAQVQATAVTLTWTAPLVGTPPFNYTIQWRVTGTQVWNSMFVGAAAGVTVIGLLPSTPYDFEVITSNV